MARASGSYPLCPQFKSVYRHHLEINAPAIRGLFINKQEGESMRTNITLSCTECKNRNYRTNKNKKNTPDRIEIKKYCKFCKKHTLHKETK